MIQTKCPSADNGKHELEHHTDAKWTFNGPKPAYLICKHCKQLSNASEHAQIKGIESQITSARAQIITTLVAFAALILSLLHLYLNFTGKI